MEQKQRKPRRKRISLADANPSWLVEWHPTKNTITPNDLSSSSARKVWWKCANGHEWENSPNNRDRGNGCPYFWSHKPFDDEEHYKALVAQIPTNQMTVAKRCLGVA